MKFLYCPKCKQLRVKPWYSLGNRCLGCFGEAIVIKVPNGWMTYLSYILYVVVPGMVVGYLTTKETVWIYAAVVLLSAMLVLQYLDLLRGEKFAKSRVRVTAADSSQFRRRGWN